jgi:diamine N-acetyltransferase
VTDVSLREITRDNFRECVRLETDEDHARFVSPNVYSIAESKVSPYLVPRAVYDGDRMVGFLMHGRVPSNGRYWLVRLMIAVPHQGRGYGKAAVLALIEELRREPDCAELYLSYVPGNAVAERLYLRLGFEKTGEVDEDGEILMRLRLER